MIRTTLIAVLLMAATVAAQPVEPPAPPETPAASDSPDQAAARQAAKDFWIAVAEGQPGQAAGMLSSEAGTDLTALVNQFADFAQVGRRFETAVRGKFADAPANSDMDPRKQVERIDHQQVLIDGQRATIGNDLELSKADGQWKVSGMGDPRSLKLIAAILPAVKKVVEETTTEVEAGKYATFAELQKAMERKEQEELRPVMQKAMMEAMKEAASAPATQPAP